MCDTEHQFWATVWKVESSSQTRTDRAHSVHFRHSASYHTPRAFCQHISTYNHHHYRHTQRRAGEWKGRAVPSAPPTLPSAVSYRVMVPFAKATSTNSDVAVTAMGSEVTGRIPPFSNKSICSTLTIVTRLPPRSPQPQCYLWQPCRTPHVFLVPRREQGVDMCRHPCALTAEHVARAAQTGTEPHSLARRERARCYTPATGAGSRCGGRPAPVHALPPKLHPHAPPFLLQMTSY